LSSVTTVGVDLAKQARHQLTEAQLLTEAIAFPPDISAAKSRHEVAGRLGLGATALVTSIVAPMPAQTASGLTLV
jgi:hypothetical protein